jgi:hypothetical protein
VVQNRPDRQKVGREHLVPVGRQCVSFSSCAPYQHAKTRHTVNGKPAYVTLPAQVATGDYLDRHKIHLAVTSGGAKFYPSCTQIRVGGSQTGTHNQTVSFPGAYNDNDPGIYDPSIYSPGAPYTFPSGPVSNLASPADMTGQVSGNAFPSLLFPTGSLTAYVL